jgi:aspartate aminotransferase
VFERIQPAPPDPILGLSAIFAADNRAHKINLGVGEYRDATGVTPVLDVVRTAESRLGESTPSKVYLPIDGTPDYGRVVRELVFGSESNEQANTVTVQSPGGTGALRIAADFAARHFSQARVWLPDPTWANHPKIFEASGLTCRSYPYYDAASRQLDTGRLLAGLAETQAGDLVLLHACCHNPTGVDLNADTWAAVAKTLAERGALPLIDFAYQGFGEGLEEDAKGLRIFQKLVPEFFVASSFSKNFGLYQDRVGALSVVTTDAEQASSVLSQLKICVRTSFSNPPAHGSALVTTILNDNDLRSLWLDELAHMRNRINKMRQSLVAGLAQQGATQDFSFITRQKGMFSFSGLNPQQVERLREEHAVYIVGSGRINVAGITPENLEGLCTAICAVL